MRFFGKTNINFMRPRNIAYVFSAVVILVGLASVLIRGLDFGIDFLGGTESLLRSADNPVLVHADLSFNE